MEGRVIVRFGGQEPGPGMLFLPNQAQQPFSIEWAGDPNQLYSIIMYDEDSPYPAPMNANSPYIHFLAVNVMGTDITTADVLAEYTPPVLPADSPPHRYLLFIFRQAGRLVLNRIQDNERARFPALDFIRLNLAPGEIIRGTVFLVGRAILVSTRPRPGIKPVAPQATPPQLRNNHIPVVGPSPVIQPARPATGPIIRPVAVTGPVIRSLPTPSRIAPALSPVLIAPPVSPVVTLPILPVISPPIVLPVTVTPELVKQPPYLKKEAPLNEKERKYCRCVLHLAGNQTPTCLVEQAWRKEREGRTCYNPYAVCASRIKTTSRLCGQNYIFENIPDHELRAYALLSGITVPKPYNRAKMLANIEAWKRAKGRAKEA